MSGKPIIRRIALLAGSCLLASASLLSCGARGREQEGTILSAYRSCLNVQDSLGAERILKDLSRKDSTLDAQLANFALAWRAYERHDSHAVFQFLAGGIPDELWDHGLWLKAQSLVDAEGETSAFGYWDSLARDTGSIYAEDALYELAENAAHLKDVAALSNLVERQRRLSSVQRTFSFDLLVAETYSEAGNHAEAIERLNRLAFDVPYTIEGRMARGMLDDYAENYGYRPRVQTEAELSRELELLAKNGKYEWGLGRIESEYKGSGWQQRNDLLLFYKGRFESGLGRHKAAVQDLQNHRAAYPRSVFRFRALYSLGRSAYLIDDDQTAIPSLLSVTDQAGDTALVSQALEMLGILYMDRHRPENAAAVLQKWVALSKGRPSHADALWRWGWALWEIKDYSGARQAWTELSLLGLDSEYSPASLYWSARAAERIGDGEQSHLLFHMLDSLYTYSYYTVVRGRPMPEDTVGLPLIPPTLDELCVARGSHTRKFAMLAALEITEPALKEWNAAQTEMPENPGFDWWKAQLQYWGGNRIEAWRTMRNNLSNYVRTAGARPADFYRIAYPLDYSTSIVKYSSEHGLDPYFVMGVICQESHFEADIVSGAGAIGLMQLMPETATTEARKLGIEHSTSKLYSADHNIQLGTAHLSDLMTEFGGDTVLVLAAYNAGKNAAHDWQAEFGDRPRDEFIKLIPYRETRLFIKRILEHTAAYRRLYPDALNRSQG